MTTETWLFTTVFIMVSFHSGLCCGARFAPPESTASGTEYLCPESVTMATVNRKESKITSLSPVESELSRFVLNFPSLTKCHLLPTHNEVDEEMNSLTTS